MRAKSLPGAGWPPPGVVARAGVFGLLLLTAAGCHRGVGVGPALQAGEQAVKLHVIQGPGGATMALVPVFINGQGPFTFAIDTGASTSVVDRDVAGQLDLPVVGGAVEMTGVATTAEARQVRVEKWRIGDVELPPRTVASLAMSDLSRKSGLQGLLGSDLLSRFGAVTVDYQRQILVVRANP